MNIEQIAMNKIIEELRKAEEKFPGFPTDREIELCRKIAKHWRKPIKCGDWFILEDNPHEFPALYFGQDLFDITKKTKLLPILTLSDCLDFLEKKGFKQGDIHFDEDLKGRKKASIYIEVSDDKGMFIKDLFKEGKTRLEAALSAVLAVVGEGK